MTTFEYDRLPWNKAFIFDEQDEEWLKEVEDAILKDNSIADNLIFDHAVIFPTNIYLKKY